MGLQKIIRQYIRSLFFVLLLHGVTCALAAPPFITDDADPAPYGTLQAFLFATGFNATHTALWYAPAFEGDLGVLNNLEFHTIIPMAISTRTIGGNAFGLSDTLIGLKWRFLTETDYRPEIAIVPDWILPTGNADRQLGNGRSWTSLPIWIEKHFGPWTTYGGGGYIFNSAKGATNYKFAGWLVQRDLSEQLTLGAEIYSQGATATRIAPAQDSGPVTLINAGGNYNFTASQSLLFSLGHSIAGAKQWVGYLGWVWNIELIKQKNEVS